MDILSVIDIWPPFGTTIVVTPPPGDLYAAIAALVLTDADLSTAFGRDDWLWQDLAAPEDGLPRAVWTQPAGMTEQESAQDAAGTPLVSWISYTQPQLAVYATARDDARTLGRQVARTIELAAQAGTLLYTDAALLFLRRSGPGLDMLDTERAPDGSDVWQHVIPFSAIEGESD